MVIFDFCDVGVAAATHLGSGRVSSPAGDGYHLRLDRDFYNAQEVSWHPMRMSIN